MCLGERVSYLEKLTSIPWKDASAIEAAITQKIPELLASDQAYQNARECSDPQNTRIEGELAVQRAISVILSDYIELFHRSGFEVLAAVHDLHRNDAEGVDPATFHAPFSELSRRDLEAAVSHFVVRRA